MDRSNRIVQVKSTLEPDVEEYPTFTPDDIGLLFGDIASPTGLILNKGDPRNVLLYFLNLDIIQKFLNWLRIPSGWVPTCISP